MYEKLPTEELQTLRKQYRNAKHKLDSHFVKFKAVIFFVGLLAFIGGIGSILDHGITTLNVVLLVAGSTTCYFWRREDQMRKFYEIEIAKMDHELVCRKDLSH